MDSWLTKLFLYDLIYISPMLILSFLEYSSLVSAKTDVEIMLYYRYTIGIYFHEFVRLFS